MQDLPAGRLIDALFRGNLDTIAEEAYRLLGNPIYIRDNSHRILAITRSPEVPADPFFRELQERGFLNEETIRGLKANKRLFTEGCFNSTPVLINFDQNKPDLLTQPVFIGQVLVCFVSAVQLCRPFSEQDRDTLMLIAKAISIELQKNDLYKKSMGLLYESFLTDLLERELSSERDLLIAQRRMEELNLRLERNLFLSVARFRKPHTANSEMNAVGRELRHILPGGLTCIFQNDIVILRSRVDSTPFSAERMQMLERFLESYGLVMILGQSYTDLGATHCRYQQLTQMLDIGCRLRPERVIHLVQDLLVFQMLHLCAPSIRLVDYVPPNMYLLRDYDRENHTDLFPTLYYYLLYQKQTNATAAKLNIHRNTLFYRLSKIAELSGFDLNDEETVFQLMLGFKILEYSALETGRKLCFKLEQDQ